MEHWRDRLRQERIRQNWRQQDLADQLGTTVVTVQRWERGSHQPSAYFRIKLCALFGKSAEDLGLAATSQPGSDPPTAGERERFLPVSFSAPEASGSLEGESMEALKDTHVLLPRSRRLGATDQEINDVTAMVNERFEADHQARWSVFDEYCYTSASNDLPETKSEFLEREKAMLGRTSLASPRSKRAMPRLLLLVGLFAVLLMGSGWLTFVAAHQGSSGGNSHQMQTLPPPAISYPSRAQAEAAISYYYTHESDFHGKNVIQHFDSLTFGPFFGSTEQPLFTACAGYRFAFVTSPEVTRDTARHTFTFQYINGAWRVIDMGNWNSC